MNDALFALALPDGWDVLIIAVMMLVLFGTKKLPLFARSLGRSMGGFRTAKEELEQEWRDAEDGGDSAPEAHFARFVNGVLYGLLGLALLLLILSFFPQTLR